MRRLILITALLLGGCEFIEGSSNERAVKGGLRRPITAKPMLLGKVRVEHPRVLITSQRFDQIRQLIQTDPVAREWEARIRERAIQMLAAKPVEYRQKGLIEVSRSVLTRMLHLGAEYQLTHDKKFADRARLEMLAAAKFPDWEPDAFLSTAEMTAAMAVGYDWTFDALGEEDRKTIRAAILDKGLLPGIDAYQKRASWTEARHNWNLVCNGGLLMGALAIHEDEAELARDIVGRSRASLDHGLSCFAPDGGWEEGPTYWNYATRYLAFYVESLRASYGSDYGVTRTRGLARTGEFRIHTLGPTGLNFNFADSEPEAGESPQMFIFADLCNKPAYATFEQQRAIREPGVLDLLWYKPADPAAVKNLSPDTIFRGVEVACLRGNWDDPHTTYVATKGGNNKAHHGHLDLGTFVLDALGQRWALDLGPDNYDLPGYNTEQRWSYYRCSTRGHNTITIDDLNQPENVAASIVAFRSTSDRAHVIINVSDAYSQQVDRVMRGIALLNRRDVLVQDEITTHRSADIAWTMHTDAQIEVKGDRATLTKNGVKLRATILSPEGAGFTVEPAEAPPPQAQQPNVKRLMIRLRADRSLRIAVLLSPTGKTRREPPIESLSRWGGTTR